MGEAVVRFQPFGNSWILNLCVAFSGAQGGKVFFICEPTAVMNPFDVVNNLVRSVFDKIIFDPMVTSNAHKSIPMQVVNNPRPQHHGQEDNRGDGDQEG